MEADNHYINVLASIKPKNVKKSDKYSKAIYKYLKNNSRYRKVYFDESKYDCNSEKYIKVKFDVNDMDLRNLYFGEPDGLGSNCITGKCINSLIVGGQCSQTTFCYMCNINSNFVDVTKEFYEKYIEIGRCIYGHGVWISDDEERFTYIDPEHRRCNWCSKEEHLEKKVLTYTKDVWKEQ
ncbi:hypothetical protein LXJ15735_27550 [Lacrimispora xylanolytica]